jgi:hypothetical protein
LSDARGDALREERVPELRVGVTAMRELLLEFGDVRYYDIATLTPTAPTSG